MNLGKQLVLALLSFFCLLVSSIAASADSFQSDFIRALKNGSAVVEREDGVKLFSYRPAELLIPASTLKVATSFCALEILGSEFRFTTEFLADERGTLFIRGGGDPALVSEELSRIGAALRGKLDPRSVNKIVIDDSKFSPNITIDGSSNTDNPYDAPPGAFLVNFNTITVKKSRTNILERGEKQTPLTPLARKLSSTLVPGLHRVNIGPDVRIGSRYAAELLAIFFNDSEKADLPEISFGTVNSSAKVIYTYESGKTLRETVRGLLQYSTNFSANQIFLVLGAEQFGYPATINKAKRALTECLERRAHWKEFSVEEGAGLSRKNRVSAEKMIQLLRAFEPYQHLLPIDQGFRAKTGSLTGVNTFVGYFDLPNGQKARFAILVNSPVPHGYKFELAHLLYRGISKAL